MSKILREEVLNDVPASGGITDLMDGLFYSFYNITSDEFDDICINASDEEINALVTAMGGIENKPTISEIRKGIEVRNKYVDYFKSK